MAASAINVAKFLISLAEAEEQCEGLTQLRLQKLLYYVQGWSIAQRSKRAFREEIEAWKNGPVVRDVWHEFKGYGNDPIANAEGQGYLLAEDDERLIESVWEHYKQFSATQLWQMTHSESPWKTARGDLGDDEQSTEVIQEPWLRDYFDRENEYVQIEGLDADTLHRAERDRKAGRVVKLDDFLGQLANGV